MTFLPRGPSASALAVAAWLAACAQTPPATPALQVASLDCASLASEIHAADEARRAAEQRRQDAWKVLVPFAVLARYGQADAAVDESGQRLAQLRRQADERGCPQP
jgi:hypothetical protein